MGNDWKHGICGCFNNCGICIVAYILPCVTVGQIAESLGNSCCCYTCLALVPIVNIVVRYGQRSKIRDRQGIDGSCCGDLLCILLCPFCALAQEAQETKHMSGGGMAQAIERN